MNVTDYILNTAMYKTISKDASDGSKPISVNNLQEIYMTNTEEYEVLSAQFYVGGTIEIDARCYYRDLSESKTYTVRAYVDGKLAKSEDFTIKGANSNPAAIFYVNIKPFSVVKISILPKNTNLYFNYASVGGYVSDNPTRYVRRIV